MSPGSTATGSPAKYSPGTPKSPIDPPRRRSSLAFSQLISGSNSPLKSMLPLSDESSTPICNIGRKRSRATPLVRTAPSPSYNSQIKRIFSNASAQMSLDMACASSPAGSIDSRLGRDSTIGPASQSPLLPESRTVQTWRYSTIPKGLKAHDVREPFPVEPPSSGYTTPESEDLPPLPASSPPVVQSDDRNCTSTPVNKLEQPLQDLSVRTAEPSEANDTLMEDLIDYEALFCPPEATAAAESAKAKRGITTRVLGNCPDVAAHRRTPPSRTSQCPDPSVHWRGPGLGKMLQPPMPFTRTNEQGSPLPPRSRASFGPGLMSRPPLRSYLSAPAPQQAYMSSLGPPHAYSTAQDIDAEHFQPGWANYAPTSPSPNTPMTYSFSTAAAKIIGSSPAPDSRIRDSYRTDTLTPFARATPKYRKTQMNAMVRERGVGKYYTENRHNGRAVAASVKPLVAFGSSPPRPSELQIQARRRKRNREAGPQSPMSEGEVDESSTSTLDYLGDDAEADDAPETPDRLEPVKELTPHVLVKRSKKRESKRPKISTIMQQVSGLDPDEMDNENEDDDAMSG